MLYAYGSDIPFICCAFLTSGHLLFAIIPSKSIHDIHLLKIN